MVAGLECLGEIFLRFFLASLLRMTGRGAVGYGAGVLGIAAGTPHPPQAVPLLPLEKVKIEGAFLRFFLAYAPQNDRKGG